jgi:hypothetical protein
MTTTQLERILEHVNEASYCVSQVHFALIFVPLFLSEVFRARQMQAELLTQIELHCAGCPHADTLLSQAKLLQEYLTAADDTAVEALLKTAATSGRIPTSPGVKP